MTTNNAVNVGLSGSNGTGAFVGNVSPSLTTPNIGTPSAGILTNCTGLPNTGIAAHSGAGIPIQVVSSSLTTTTSIASATPVTTGVSASITPTAATSNILIMAMINIDIASSDTGFLQIYNGTSAIGIGTSVGSRTACTAVPTNPATAGQMVCVPILWIDSPATTSTITYTIQAWSTGGAQSYVNRSITDTNTASFPRSVSSIVLMEIK